LTSPSASRHSARHNPRGLLQGLSHRKGFSFIPLYCVKRNDKDFFDNGAELHPDRWIGKSQTRNFGYGRRICPGHHIAHNSASIVIARLLWAFNICRPNGRKFIIEERMFTAGFVSSPKPFACVFGPWSDTHVRVCGGGEGALLQGARRESEVVLEDDVLELSGSA